MFGRLRADRLRPVVGLDGRWRTARRRREHRQQRRQRRCRDVQRADRSRELDGVRRDDGQRGRREFHRLDLRRPLLYLAPYGNGNSSGTVARYDSQASFSVASSWGTFDTTAVNANAAGFSGAAFDGRYVYLVPNADTAGHDGIVARYDTQAPFANKGSWATFNTSTVAAKAKGFVGAVFDGRYIYFVPDNNGAVDGVVARYDTQATFTTVASWTTFDTTTVNANAKGFVGAVFDSRYVYFVSYNNGAADGLVMRYDTQATFTTVGSWTTFDVTTVNAGATGFETAAFDGRYIYLVPLSTGIVARYDTQAGFTAARSWATFDATTVNMNASGFNSATFDGRYIYLVPIVNTIIARYDTQQLFTDASSWSGLDTTTIQANAKGYLGGAFDGRYVYLVPYQNGVALRFDAKSPSAIPQLCSNAEALHCYTGSFF